MQTMKVDEGDRVVAAPGGILGGSGSEPLHVTVCTAGPPDSPPAELAGHVVPVRDRHGHLADWHLSELPGGGRRTAAEIATYRDWHAGYSVRRFIGEQAFVAAFLAWAQRSCDVSALDPLRLPGAHVDWSTALRMRWHADRAQHLVHESTDQGFGIFAPPEHHSATRALIPTDPATVVLATGDARLTVGYEGLRLHVRGAHGRGGSRSESFLLEGWELRGDAVELLTQAQRVQLQHAGAASLLETLGRHAGQVRVRQQPISRLAATMLLSLRDAVTLAANFRTGIAVGIGWV